MNNTNANLDPQNAEHRLAHVMPDEAIDHTPDPYHDAQTYEPDEHRGWPGDGSGEDDLADLMAHGDEGCCDGPECDDAPCDDAHEAEDAYLDASWEDRNEMDF